MNLSRTLAVALLAAAAFAVPASAQALKPYQQVALEKLLAQTDPAVRPMAEPGYRQMLVGLDESQVKTMLAAMAQAAAEDGSAGEDPSYDEAPDAEASPEDLAYNAAQYKPVIRKSWEARRAWDAFVAEKNAALQGQSHYAVFGSGWGYDLTPLMLREEPTTDNFALYDGIFSNYAPTDGRYRFDFSTVRTSFDKARVDGIIAATKKDYDALGATFVTKAKQMADASDFDGLFKYYQATNAKASALLEQMNNQIAAEAPTDGTGLSTMLLMGEKLN